MPTQPILPLLHALTPLRVKYPLTEADHAIVYCLLDDLTACVGAWLASCGKVPEIRILDAFDPQSIKGKYDFPILAAQKDDTTVHKRPWLYLQPYTTHQPFTHACQYLSQLNIPTFFINPDFDANFPWIHNATMDPAFFYDKRERFQAIFEAFSDAASQDVFLRVLKARLSRTIGFLPISTFPEYCHPMAVIHQGDNVIDAGIGHYIRPTLSFAERCGKTGHVYAFEPESHSYTLARKVLGSISNITITKMGLWKERAKLAFNETNDDSSHICAVHHQEQTDQPLAHLIDLDSFVQERHLTCNFVKMDIEGAEPEALLGAEKTIRSQRPTLAICVYHAPFEQFFIILDFLVHLDLGYHFYMSHHSPFYIDTIVYAVPSDRP